MGRPATGNADGFNPDRKCGWQWVKAAAFGASAEFGAELLQVSDGLLTFLEIEGIEPTNNAEAP
jgi:hypothetical protein